MPRRPGITLHLKAPTTIPIEADVISPDRFEGLTLSDVAALTVFYGRRRMPLGELFDIDDGDGDDITVCGDLRSFKKIGYGMTRGRITLTGDVGPHLGAHMSGGEVLVEGSAGDWVGAHMSGGRITVSGSAGHYLGAAYSGEKRGVLGGTILVRGSCGREVGSRMRRGLIVVIGDSGEFTGAGMIAGSIFVGRRLGLRAGAGMKRGTIVALGDVAALLPTFRFVCRYRPIFLDCYFNHFGDLFAEAACAPQATFRRYVGDMNTVGRGEILVRDQSE